MALKQNIFKISNSNIKILQLKLEASITFIKVRNNYSVRFFRPPPYEI